MSNVVHFPILQKSKGLGEKVQSIASELGDKGGIVISLNENGDAHIGTSGLTPDELRGSLCLAIHYSFIFEKKTT